MKHEASRPILLLAQAVLFAVSGQAAVAESVVYRFEAEFGAVHVPPPAGSTTARAASARTLTGTFGYDRDVRQSSAAGIPGRVAFADYATGVISVDQLDIGTLPGQVVTQVTDGRGGPEDPAPGIDDAVTIGHRAVSTASAIDSVTLELRYKNAGALGGVAMPAALNAEDFASIRLRFSTRVDGTSNRGGGRSAAIQVLGLVVFNVTTIQRVE